MALVILTKKFSAEIAMVAGKKIFNIKWASNTLPVKAYKKIATYSKAEKNYSALTDEKLIYFTTIVDSINEQCDSRMTVYQAISIRNIVKKDKIIRGYSRMSAKMNEILKRYLAGESIVKLSKVYDFPPLNLLRGILLAEGADPTAVYSIFVKKLKPENLNQRAAAQFLIAEKNDAESTFNLKNLTDVASMNENSVVRFFRDLGVGVKTQDELTAEQMLKHGRAIVTPDLFFTDIVYINNERITWIDYKDYICTQTPFLYKSNVEQAGRYYDEWGIGVLCYRYGVVEGVQISGSMILDAQSLPIYLV